MERTNRLIDHYLPPAEGFELESLVATTYEIDFEFLEEELLAAALGVRSSISRLKAFRSELERKLQNAEVSVLYDLGACERLSRLSPRIDAIPISTRKLHAKISLLMWIRDNGVKAAPPDRRIRLVVGSANLTRHGFRQNYECIVSLDFGARSTSQRTLLMQAVEMVKEISAELEIPQLSRQLAAFAEQAALLPDGPPAPDDPIALVGSGEVLTTLRDAWTKFSNKGPDTVTVVSPFWTEGTKAHEALFQLFQQLGSPTNFELVCGGEKTADGKTWLPIFDGHIATELRGMLTGRLFLRAALPNADTQPTSSQIEAGDEQEERELATHLPNQIDTYPEIHRALHAKMILLDGTTGNVLYAGSSNCTRRGLGLGGPRNFEAGFVFHLTSRQRKNISKLLAFAGPAVEIYSERVPATIQPTAKEDTFAPMFLGEVIAAGTMITLRFSKAIPSDTVVLMPNPKKVGDSEYWLLYKGDGYSQSPAQTITVDLVSCPQCDELLHPLGAANADHPIVPHVFAEVRWEGHSARFPIRFDDKARLPLLLIGRKLTEGELIDYFLFGKEPPEWEDTDGTSGNGYVTSDDDSPVDTRRILAYFVRRFIQAIPGIEAEIRRASYSRVALESALRGPTSPLELAERAFSSLGCFPAHDEPKKTPTAVGFQIIEILAVLQRCLLAVSDPDLLFCFEPVLARCQELLNTLVSQHADLRTAEFGLYRAQVLGENK